MFSLPEVSQNLAGCSTFTHSSQTFILRLGSVKNVKIVNKSDVSEAVYFCKYVFFLSNNEIGSITHNSAFGARFRIEHAESISREI